MRKSLKEILDKEAEVGKPPKGECESNRFPPLETPAGAKRVKEALEDEKFTPPPIGKQTVFRHYCLKWLS